jgi:hypothetical protein
MRWPVVFIGMVLVLGVILFALLYDSPFNRNVSEMPKPVATTTLGTTTSWVPGSGVSGRVQVNCLTSADDPVCAPQVRTIEAYQGVAAVAFFKTALDGTFRSELPAGHYELRVDAPSSTRCVSVGVVVPENSTISTNLQCQAGMP